MSALPELSSRLHRHAFLDIETTGLDPRHDGLLEVGVVLVVGGAVQETRRWLVRHVGPLAPEIRALTGLDEAELALGQPPEVVLAELDATLDGYTVVAHNADFERSFLGPVLEGRPVLDSLELVHLLQPGLVSHSLTSMVSWARIRSSTRHRAVEDALDTAQVVTQALDRAEPQVVRAIQGELTGEELLPARELLREGPGPSTARPSPAWALPELEEAIGRLPAPVVVALPSSLLRRAPHLAESSHDLTLVRTLLHRLREPLPRAYVCAALASSEPFRLSGFLRRKYPELDALDTLCRRERAAVPLPEGPVLAVSHAQAVAWVGRALAFSLVALDSRALVEAFESSRPRPPTNAEVRRWARALQWLRPRRSGLTLDDGPDEAPAGPQVLAQLEEALPGLEAQAEARHLAARIRSRLAAPRPPSGSPPAQELLERLQGRPAVLMG